MCGLFRGMIGPGPNRVGNAEFHLMYGFRNIDDTLNLGWYVSVVFHCNSLSNENLVSQWVSMNPTLRHGSIKLLISTRTLCQNGELGAISTSPVCPLNFIQGFTLTN